MKTKQSPFSNESCALSEKLVLLWMIKLAENMVYKVARAPSFNKIQFCFYFLIPNTNGKRGLEITVKNAFQM